MTKLSLINSEDAKVGLETLKKYYENKLIPAEKKNYLTDLRESVGPYMGIVGCDGKTHYFLDAASQIATLAHGFNSSIFFGTSEFLESWTNDTSTREFKDMRIAFQNFFNRKLNWKKTYLTFVHSGAEANETALGYCYKSRIHKNANKVLAFEGSFHGRMMVTLAATWNKSKREPFEWKNYLAEYVSYPESPNGKMHLPMPKNWRETWNESSLKNFKSPIEWEELAKSDQLLKKELKILNQIRNKLISKEIFAIIVELMQCEGGESYSSDRFHTALLLMAKTFKIPVIHDEVQTGFHLGKEFFWHRELNLTGLSGEQINPDYVTCAKKAQVGIVLSHKETKNIFKGEEFSAASAFRGYAHAISIDQSQNQIKRMEQNVAIRLEKLISDNANYIGRPRFNGLAFGFDLLDPSLLNKCVDLRFKHGLLYYPAGEKTLRFRVNLKFGEKDLDFLFNRLHAIIRELCANEITEIPGTVTTDNSNSKELYDWHEFLIQTKLDKKSGKKINSSDILPIIEKFIAINDQTNLIEINAYNFLEFREEIILLQKEVYEPARQTDIEKFEHTVLNKNSLCLGVMSKNKLIGIAFAGPLKLYPLERGVRNDPSFHDEDCLYMLDVTISPAIKGSKLGRSLKYAISALALTKGVKKIQGRNRDRLAAPMININLSLGAIEQSYMHEDYPDFETHRDVFYYTTKADWRKPIQQLSKAMSMPITSNSLTQEYVSKQLPFLVNKICLSNFVSETFLKEIKEVISLLPENLRHSYTCSGQSECVDKIAKTIWVKSRDEIKSNNVNKMLTFKGHFFGNGSSLARSLSYDFDPYFDVVKVNNPNEINYLEILKQVETIFLNQKILAVWIEPLMQKTMEKIPYEFLKGLREITHKYQVALIYNETASNMYRYSTKNYFVSSFNDLTPDAGFIYTGGQSGITFTDENYYLESPLMLISTWDGDEFSFNTYYEAFNYVQKNKEHYFETMKKFQSKIIDQLSRFELDVLKLENGIGYFKGSIPASIEKMFIRNELNQYIICPSFDAMKEYLDS